MFYYKFKYIIFGIEFLKLNVIKYDIFLGCEGEI